MTVFAFTPDLIDRSRLKDVADRFVSDASVLRHAGVQASTDIVVIDLTREGVLEAAADLAREGVRIVGYGPHVDHELLEAARLAGCTIAMPRSRFFADPQAAIDAAR